jgi:hypothetical protein
MIAYKRITKILIVLAAFAIAVCLLVVFFSGQLTEPLGGKGVTME